MKTFIFCFFIISLISSRVLTGSPLTSNQACQSCIDSTDSYACANTPFSSSGYKLYCCDDTKSKSDCVGSNADEFLCTNQNLPARAQYLLCPKETVECQDTDDFVITQTNVTNRIDTGVVSPGKTCQYRTYINNTFSSSGFISNYDNGTNYEVTVDVEYVHSDTVLGVYKYHKTTNTYELVTEENSGFNGNITTKIDPNTEVYVQMHSFSSSSCAGFDVHFDTYDGDEESVDVANEDIHISMFVVIIPAFIWGVTIFGAICLFIIYHKCCKTRQRPETVPDTKGVPEVIMGVPTVKIKRREKMYVINHNYDTNKEVISESITEAVGSPEFESENTNEKMVDANDQEQYLEVIIAHIPVNQQQSI